MLKKIINFLKKLLGFDSCGEVHYINSQDILPTPLNPDEETALIAKYLNGDNDAKKSLIEHNIRLVVYIAKKFENTNVDMEDLISVGTIGLIKAINSFKPDKQIKLATYGARCIENEILMYLRKNSKSKNDISLDMPLNVDSEGNALLLSDIIGTSADIVYKDSEISAEKEMIQKCTNTLPERERQIIKLRFGILGAQKHTQKEIAELMGISQSYISRLEKKVILKMRKELKKLV